MRDRRPAGELLFHAVNFVVSFGVITFLVAAIFKILPAVPRVARSAHPGGSATAGP